MQLPFSNSDLQPRPIHPAAGAPGKANTSLLSLSLCHPLPSSSHASVSTYTPPLLPRPPPCSPFLEVHVQKHSTATAVPSAFPADLFKTGLRLLSTEEILWDLRTRETLFWLSNRDNEPTMAIRLFEKNLSASSKSKITTFQRRELSGFEVHGLWTGKGNGIKCNISFSHKRNTYSEIPHPFPKNPRLRMNVQHKTSKEVVLTGWIAKSCFTEYSHLNGPIHGH